MWLEKPQNAPKNAPKSLVSGALKRTPDPRPKCSLALLGRDYTLMKCVQSVPHNKNPGSAPGNKETCVMSICDVVVTRNL
jgi:hypothetical protein